MLGIDNFFTFIITALIINITPGTDTMYVLTRSIAQGRLAGFYSVLGISTGCVVHTLLASFGLSVLLNKLPILYAIIKYCGIAYLMFLGLKMLLQKSSIFDNSSNENCSISYWNIYRQGLIINVLNPKVALFFISFLPQFIDVTNSTSSAPFLILGLIFVFTSTCWGGILTYTAAKSTQALRQTPAIENNMKKLSGVIFISLAVKMIFAK